MLITSTHGFQNNLHKTNQFLSRVLHTQATPPPFFHHLTGRVTLAATFPTYILYIGYTDAHMCRVWMPFDWMETRSPSAFSITHFTVSCKITHNLLRAATFVFCTRLYG